MSQQTRKKSKRRVRSEAAPTEKGIDQNQPFDTYETPGHLIRRLQQSVVGLYYERLLDTGVTPVQFTSMMALRRYPGVDQRKLAKLVALDRSTVGSVVERLERRGLIVREPSATDGRRKALYITQQ